MAGKKYISATMKPKTPPLQPERQQKKSTDFTKTTEGLEMSAPKYLSGKKACIETIQRQDVKMSPICSAIQEAEAVILTLGETRTDTDSKALRKFAQQMDQLSDEWERDQ